MLLLLGRVCEEEEDGSVVYSRLYFCTFTTGPVNFTTTPRDVSDENAFSSINPKHGKLQTLDPCTPFSLECCFHQFPSSSKLCFLLFSKCYKDIIFHVYLPDTFRIFFHKKNFVSYPFTVQVLQTIFPLQQHFPSILIQPEVLEKIKINHSE